VIAVLRDPDDVDSQSGDTMTASSLLCHNGLRQSYHSCGCQNLSGDEYQLKPPTKVGSFGLACWDNKTS
jgi:hypothetical protein